MEANNESEILLKDRLFPILVNEAMSSCECPAGINLNNVNPTVCVKIQMGLWKKTYGTLSLYIAMILDCEKLTEQNWVSEQTWRVSALGAAGPQRRLAPLQSSLRWTPPFLSHQSAKLWGFFWQNAVTGWWQCRHQLQTLSSSHKRSHSVIHLMSLLLRLWYIDIQWH